MNIRIWLVALCILWTISLHAQESKMTETEIAKFKTEIAKATKINTLVADFTQYKKVGFVKNEMVSSGKFYVKHPDKLAWIYSAPVKYSMIFNDRKMYINDQGKARSMDLSRNKQFEKINQAIQSHIGGVYSGNDFSTVYLQSPKYYILKMDPMQRDVKKAMKQIVLYFAKSDYVISELQLHDVSGGYTRYVLNNKKINGMIDESVFKL